MIAVLAFADQWARRLVAYPLVLIGFAGAHVAAALILAGAWLLDVSFEEDE